MKIHENISVLPYNTFGIDVKARIIAEYNSVEELIELLNRYKGQPILPVGEGSNLLFTKDYDGVLLISRMQRARAMKEDTQQVWIEAESGLKLDDLIAQLVDMNLTGMENLSYIPGTVGASAVQNVGAYGVEAKDVIESVETIEIATLKPKIFTNAECRFGYRDSVFKNELKGQYVVTKVVYRLHKDGPLLLDRVKTMPMPTTAQEVRESVIAIRRNKLPEVGVIGSAGSFFKNPVIGKTQFASLREQYPDMPYYEEGEGIKVPAAWLIEQCGWKGKKIGGAQVFEKQPLVIINAGYATSADIIALAAAVVDSVYKQFEIMISPEVNYI
ncbi:MAG: UDP-N-acetylmuramate dehydrogenase [Paludibacteraceae bacterium]|nr:UDP-N-acetylmuramate dehydrogenase [Paludibacteraceae bacterium]